MAKPGFDVKVEINFDGLVKREQEAKKYALWRQGQAIIAEAQRMALVPIETGTLRRSAVVTLSKLPSMAQVYGKAEASSGNAPVVIDDPKRHSEDVDTVYVSYNTPYAAYLHENLQWQPRDWRRTASGNIVSSPLEGTAKWIEYATMLIRPKFAEIAANAIRRYFKL